MNVNTPKISVIIPTYNGKNTIIYTLQALEKQTIKEFQTIVVIDGSIDGTEDYLKNRTFGLHSLVIIYQENKGRSAARNRGSIEASGDYLIFYDDDTRPESDSVEKHMRFHKINTKSICAGYPKEDSNLLTTEIYKYKIYLSERWTSKYKSGINKINAQSFFLTSANLSIPKNLFNEIGGFDERLTDAEDYEFGLRALKMGYPIYFDKNNISWHDNFITCKSYIERQRQYYNANKLLKEIIPPSFARKELKPDMLPLYKRSVYSFFARSYWVSWIDKDRLSWLPRFIKFRIYDWVITGLSKVFVERNIHDREN